MYWQFTYSLQKRIIDVSIKVHNKLTGISFWNKITNLPSKVNEKKNPKSTRNYFFNLFPKFFLHIFFAIPSKSRMHLKLTLNKNLII